MFHAHLPGVEISLPAICFKCIADHPYWPFVVVKTLACSLSPQALGPTRVFFLSDIFPWSPQHLLKSPYSFSMSSSLDPPFSLTSDIYGKKKCFLFYSMQNFSVFLVEKILCYIAINSASSPPLKHIVL